MAHGLELNPAQREGVAHRGGPLLLLAGAGTGKTRVITHRVAALIDEGVPAWRILAVTFTNKAAQEMRERIAGLLGLELDELRRSGPWIGTFHSICARILRRHGEAVGLSRNFAIYDVDDQKRLMRKVLKTIDVDPRMFSASAALGKIDQAKNLGKTRAQLDDFGWGEPVLSWTRRAWALYEDQLRAADAADFGDLLGLAVELLRKAKYEGVSGPPGVEARGPSASTAEGDNRSEGRRTVKLQTSRKPASTAVDPVVGLRRRFLHVVVDEYQDTNPVQAELVELLCSDHTQLCVVGDDDQAIYGWRGADVGQILGFPDRNPGCEIIRLEQNYRSTTLILDCANALIKSAASRRHGKHLWSELGEGLPVELCGFPDEREEARFVARTVQAAIDDGESPSEIAVFYRTHAQSRPLEEAMRMYGIRYRMLGGIRFYDRREIKDLVAYLRLLTNPASDIDCLRVINVPPRRIGAKSIERLSSWASRNETSIYAATGPDSDHGAAAGLGKAASRAVKGFWDLVEGMRGVNEQLDHHQLAALALERTGYLDSLELEPDGETRIENLTEFVGALEEFVNEQPEASLAEYLEQISLATSGDETSYDEAIILMTIHSAKGLEFDRVMLTGMEDNVFPHARVFQDNRELDEERRLAYVALTRARRKLALSYVEARFLWGEAKLNEPSMFLDDLPEQAVARRGLAAKPKRKRKLVTAPRARTPSWDDDIELEPEYVDSTPVGRQAQLGFGATAGGRVGAAVEAPLEPEPVVEPEIEYEAEASAEIFKGMRVRHPKFGVGTVLAWSGSGRNTKLELRFGNSRKTILARFCEPA